MSNNALNALHERQKRYPDFARSCHQVFETAMKMNKIPTTLFCGRLPDIWQPECQIRVRSRSNITMKKFVGFVEINVSLSTTTIIVISLSAFITLSIIVGSLYYYCVQRKRTAELVMYESPFK